MGLSEQPFMYDHPAKYTFLSPTLSDLNAAQPDRASWVPMNRDHARRPLIASERFNRHPDSYCMPLARGYAKPMHPKTRSRVKWIRKFQLLLRAIQLILALATLFCVICIKNLDIVSAWITRVSPAVGILHSTYAIYHLAKAADHRTPASTASYMLFAATIDSALIPFFAFTAYGAQMQLNIVPPGLEAWTTFFSSKSVTHAILLATYLGSAVNGGLHVLTLIISIILGILFRKIARLPPDMNPLESQKWASNKEENSSGDKRISQASTIVTNEKACRDIQDSLSNMEPTIPFLHTRKESFARLSADQLLQNRNTFESQCSPPRSLRQGPHSTHELRPKSSRSDMPASNWTEIDLNPSRYTHQSSRSSSPVRAPILNKPSSVYSQSTNATHQGQVSNRASVQTIRMSHHAALPSPPAPPPRTGTQSSQGAQYFDKQQGSPQSRRRPGQPILTDSTRTPLEMNPPTPVVSHYIEAPSRYKLTSTRPQSENRSQDFDDAGSNMQAQNNSSPRVVSSSGVQVQNAKSAPNSGIRARDVSGQGLQHVNMGGFI